MLGAWGGDFKTQNTPAPGEGDFLSRGMASLVQMINPQGLKVVSQWLCVLLGAILTC